MGMKKKEQKLQKKTWSRQTKKKRKKETWGCLGGERFRKFQTLRHPSLIKGIAPYIQGFRRQGEKRGDWIIGGKGQSN